MCFSAEADFAAGVVVGAISVGALRQVHLRRELPLASLPALFAGHQIAEAFVWLDLTDRAPAATGRVALWLYMLFAYVVLPVVVPSAVLAVEPDPTRRRWLAGLTAVGGAVAVAYLVAMVRGPIGVSIDGHSLNYDTGVASGGQLAAVYVVACCGSLLLSSHRSIVVFGVANAVAVAFLWWALSEELTSLWCFWATIASVAITTHLGGRRRGTEAAQPSLSRAAPSPPAGLSTSSAPSSPSASSPASSFSIEETDWISPRPWRYWVTR